MAPLCSIVAATLLFLLTANAYFELLQPPSLEGAKLNKDLETNGACGGGVPDLSSTTDFHVDGDSVAIFLGQPQANILIGATLNPQANGGWAQLYPLVQQRGLGNFCQPAVTAPKDATSVLPSTSFRARTT
ncbi:hypothetical protein NEMBOFW57_009538 [Staphylotrichum longicolle]|uniref:Copper acquisition factor BIM1-like domain-containing protein n=1 Tax=Staphylotrichum longicolle TaxID=669026 RepID=A0AAD4EP76_9PEZI|nr:hypothetical protein NEMBOFW57_009538 [Staphylotrichum longicolle]